MDMYDYNLVEERDVLCIDQKSFCKCVLHTKGLDPKEVKLAVVVILNVKVLSY